VGANVTSFSNTGLSANTTYTYRVYASNAGGNSAYAGPTSAITAGSSCTYSIAPTNTWFMSDGGTRILTVTSTTGCSWTAVSSAPWITIIGPASGTGGGSVLVYYSVSPYDGELRTGTISVGSQTFTVMQPF
jgi:hypothetical protein